MKKAWLLLVLLSCAPTAQPGGHIVRRFHLAETPLPAECGVDAVFAARELETEFWVATTGRSAMRYVTRGELGFGTRTPILLPAGVWSDDGSYVTVRAIAGDAGTEVQRLEVALSQPTDGGAANGALFFCSHFGIEEDCRAIPGACVARIPFTIERLAQSSDPLPGLSNPIDGARQFDVAVQTAGSVCSLGTGESKLVTFEVWQLKDDTLTVPVSAARYGEGASGALRRDGGVFRSDGEADVLQVSAFRDDVLDQTGTIVFKDCSPLNFLSVAR